MSIPVVRHQEVREEKRARNTTCTVKTQRINVRWKDYYSFVFLVLLLLILWSQEPIEPHVAHFFLRVLRY